jgi:hypothetical protein
MALLFCLLLGQFASSLHDATLKAHSYGAVCEICICISLGSDPYLSPAASQLSGPATIGTRVLPLQDRTPTRLRTTAHYSRAPSATCSARPMGVRSNTQAIILTDFRAPVPSVGRPLRNYLPTVHIFQQTHSRLATLHSMTKPR